MSRLRFTFCARATEIPHTQHANDSIADRMKRGFTPMYIAHGYAAQSATGRLEPFTFERRDLRANDVLIDILYSGVCHSDIHTVRNEWEGSVYPDGTIYPALPDHETV
jgi:hypothetical protein